MFLAPLLLFGKISYKQKLKEEINQLIKKKHVVCSFFLFLLLGAQELPSSAVSVFPTAPPTSESFFHIFISFVGLILLILFSQQFSDVAFRQPDLACANLGGH